MALKKLRLLSAPLALLAIAGLASASPQLRLSTTAIGIINIAPGTNGTTQVVQSSNAGDGSLNLTVSSSASWLAATVSNGNINIALNTAGLAPGSYTEFVNVNAANAIDAPQSISVTVQVGGVPASVDLYVTPNGGTASQTVLTRSQVNASATTSSGGNWLSVALNGQGSFNFFYPYLVAAKSQAGQAEGNYVGTVTFAGGSTAADNKSFPVNLHVTSQPILQYSSVPVRLSGGAGGAKVTQNVKIPNGGQGTLTITGATVTTTSGGNWLAAGVLDAGTVTVTADPAGLAAGTYSGAISIASNAANTAQTLPVQFQVGASSAPVISFGGVVDNATAKPNLSPGDIGSIYGIQLAGSTPTPAASLPLSTALGGVIVRVNGVAAPLYYVSAGQINFQVPSETQAGPAIVAVTANEQTGNQVSTNIIPRAPRILLTGISNYGIIINQDGSFPMPPTTGFNSHAAKRGDALTIYAIGLGATDVQVPNGTGAPASEPLARTPVPQVFFGGGFASTPTPGQILYSGLTPGFVGLYQINVIIPDDAPFGDAIGLVMQLETYTSNNVSIAIQR